MKCYCDVYNEILFSETVQRLESITYRQSKILTLSRNNEILINLKQTSILINLNICVAIRHNSHFAIMILKFILLVEKEAITKHRNYIYIYYFMLNI